MNLILTDSKDITEDDVKSLDKIILRGDNIIMVALPDKSNSFNPTLSIHPTLSFPCCPQSVLYICVSIPALQIGSSVPFL